ncbi:MAG: lysine--tRNA ligase [Proteobacteria bacterium]|nr:lysine--tRNA ligase [Pseudomonadota bacterium]
MHNIEKYLKSNAWPFKEAEKILQRINNRIPDKGFVLFETGYGPSGLPHIGTFGEVARTSMVRHAFISMTEGKIPTELWCISDDMDGMRKIPDTIPNPQNYKQYLDLPLTKIPDPFGTHESFGHNMNARLRKFLDTFGFQYTFFSASECYKNGIFNKMLVKVLEHYDEVMQVMLPTLGAERQATYSPFLPVCKKTGRVLQVPIVERDLNAKKIAYKDQDTSELIWAPIIDGHCKLQWKPDFGMRWAAFDVDFEMYGKDHLVNGPIYSRICSIIGGRPPHQMFYELFLDEKGEKISKSKGNGITIDEWLRYAPQESLALFMYQSPQKAKKLYFDVIPKCVDEYLTHLAKYHASEDESARLANPVHHIHKGQVPHLEVDGINYALLLNLVNACNSDDSELIWGYIRKFDQKANMEKCPMLTRMVASAVNYYQDFVKPQKKYRNPTDAEKIAMLDLAARLERVESFEHAEELQSIVYAVARDHEIEQRLWFQALYQVLLGAEQGPRFGSFIALYGVANTITLIKTAVERLV